MESAREVIVTHKPTEVGMVIEEAKTSELEISSSEPEAKPSVTESQSETPAAFATAAPTGEVGNAGAITESLDQATEIPSTGSIDSTNQPATELGNDGTITQVPDKTAGLPVTAATSKVPELTTAKLMLSPEELKDQCAAGSFTSEHKIRLTSCSSLDRDVFVVVLNRE